jgi:hypothetical protein
MPRYVPIIGIVFVFLTTLQLVYAGEVRKVIGKIDQVAAHSASYERYETSSKGVVFIYINRKTSKRTTIVSHLNARVLEIANGDMHHEIRFFDQPDGRYV